MIVHLETYNHAVHYEKVTLTAVQFKQHCIAKKTNYVIRYLLYCTIMINPTSQVCHLTLLRYTYSIGVLRVIFTECT